MRNVFPIRRATSLLRFSGALNRPLSAHVSGYLENGKLIFGLHEMLHEVRAKLSAPSFGNLGMIQNVSAPYGLGFRNFIHSTGRRDDEMGRSSRPMDFVRGIIEEDGKRFMGSSHFPRYCVKRIADFVYIKLMCNSTFVIVTDSEENKKIRALSSCLPELKGAPKMSRYAAKATAEYFGHLTRNMGI